MLAFDQRCGLVQLHHSRIAAGSDESLRHSPVNANWKERRGSVVIRSYFGLYEERSDKSGAGC